MFTKSMLNIWVASIGCLVILSLCIGAPNPAAAQDCNLYGCDDDCEFTADFRIDTCSFKSKGINPWFVLLPGYTSVLETPQDEEERERSVATVLDDTQRIHLNGRRIETRVVEERAFEWDNDEDEWVNIEISRNYFAICEKTNAVYYFGEWSRDCEDGFDENDLCRGEESNKGSWEAGIDGARPGLIMPGTPLLGARYFQEIAPPNAVDRGEIVATGLEVDLEAGRWSGCIQTSDTNPAEKICGEGDEKTYCPSVGLVQDENLELVWSGFAGRDEHHGRKYGDRDHKMWRWKWR